ncbi:MAG: hypothetical protein IJP64_06655, partial [Oscillospiraceae bacterium]|nr:hypothetical protein [Oscillospiraceae bacterium]
MSFFSMRSPRQEKFFICFAIIAFLEKKGKGTGEAVCPHFLLRAQEKVAKRTAQEGEDFDFFLTPCREYKYRAALIWRPCICAAAEIAALLHPPPAVQSR